MGTVSYNSQKIIPAPFASINKVYQKSANGEILGKIYNIVLAGTLVSHKGSPSSSGTFWNQTGYPPDESVGETSKLGAILRKQKALMQLFSDEGRSLEIQSLDGTQPMKCNPRVISIDFPNGQWFTQAPFTINLEADTIYPIEIQDSGLGYLSDANETWNIETDEQAEDENSPRIYRLSHTVSAIGKRFYNEDGSFTKQPWEHARDYVLPRLGFDSNVALSSGVNNLPSYYGGYNHTRSETRDEGGGSYSVTETWILTSGTALEDFTIETNKESNSALTRVSIQGNITGLEQRDSNLNLTTSKYQNALSRFTLASGLALSRAQVYSGYTLNIVPVLDRVGRNPVAGTINYGFEYNDRPSTIVSGALSEVISISDGLDTNTIAIIPVLGRARGPVLQPLSTRGELSRQLSIELVMPRPTFASNSLSDLQSAFFGQRPVEAVSGIISAVSPANQGFSLVYMTQNTESWIATEGRYSRNISWIYEL